VIISGDYILSPERYIDEMENALIGTRASEDEVLSVLKRFYEKNHFQSPQTYPEDFADAIMKAVAVQNG